MVTSGEIVFSNPNLGLAQLQGLGRVFAQALQGGDIVLFYGPLGVGKTTFIRAITKCLKVTDPVRSPSFTIANVYSGRMTVFHLDLYRLERIGEDDVLALEEYERDDAVTLVEWPQAGVDRLSAPTWTVTMGHVSPDKRSVEITATSEEAARRWREAARSQAREEGQSE